MDIIETHQLDLLRDVDLLFMQDLIGGDGHDIVTGQNTVHVGVLLQSSSVMVRPDWKS